MEILGLPRCDGMKLGGCCSTTFLRTTKTRGGDFQDIWNWRHGTPFAWRVSNIQHQMTLLFFLGWRVHILQKQGQLGIAYINTYIKIKILIWIYIYNYDRLHIQICKHDIYIYLEPKWPLIETGLVFEGGPSKNRGHLGSRYIYIYCIFIIYRLIFFEVCTFNLLMQVSFRPCCLAFARKA